MIYCSHLKAVLWLVDPFADVVDAAARCECPFAASFPSVALN